MCIFLRATNVGMFSLRVVQNDPIRKQTLAWMSLWNKNTAFVDTSEYYDTMTSIHNNFSARFIYMLIHFCTNLHEK